MLQITATEASFRTAVPLTRRLLLAGFSVGLLTTSIVACSTADQEEAQDPITSGEEVVFTGTPDEYFELMRSCFEDNGIETVDSTSGSGTEFGYPATEEADTAEELCSSTIGEPQMQGLSEEQLRERYEGRLDQWECLAAEGLLSGEPMSYETFVDEYRRSGETEMWLPFLEVNEDAGEGDFIDTSGICVLETW